MPNANFESLLAKLEDRTATVGVIGLGYVGLPLAITSATRGLKTIGFDTDPKKMQMLSSGQSPVDTVAKDALTHVTDNGTFSWTTGFAQLSECDVIVICGSTLAG